MPGHEVRDWCMSNKKGDTGKGAYLSYAGQDNQTELATMEPVFVCKWTTTGPMWTTKLWCVKGSVCRSGSTEPHGLKKSKRWGTSSFLSAAQSCSREMIASQTSITRPILSNPGCVSFCHVSCLFASPTLYFLPFLDPLSIRKGQLVKLLMLLETNLQIAVNATPCLTV